MRNVVLSLGISIKVEFSRIIMNPRVIEGQNEHNNKNQRKSLSRELYEYYCFVLHKRLNSIRNHIHYLAE